VVGLFKTTFRDQEAISMVRHSRRVAFHTAWIAGTAAVLVVAAAAGMADSGDAWIGRGDSLYAQSRLPGSRDAYRAALQIEPLNFRALCRIARVESELGEDTKGGEQTQLIAAAVEHARAAVGIAPDSAEGHVWLAVALGREALKQGPKQRLALSREVKAEADRAIQIDPTSGRAYHVRALWNRKIASLNAFERLAANAALGGVPHGASMANAVRDLEKAVELEPNYVNHHLELGRTFAMLHRHADARRELERAIALPPTSSARDPILQSEARALVRKL